MSHLALLDRFGDAAFQQKKKSYQQEYTSYRELEKRVRKVQQNEKSYVQRIDMLHFQQEEIAAADLQQDVIQAGAVPDVRFALGYPLNNCRFSLD